MKIKLLGQFNFLMTFGLIGVAASLGILFLSSLLFLIGLLAQILRIAEAK